MSKRPKIPSVGLGVALLQGSGPRVLDTSWQGADRASRHERGYGTEWDRTRLRILKRDRYICQCNRCKTDGVVRSAIHVDHKVNKAEGGTDEDDNLQAINRDCHKIKTAEEAARGIARLHPSR